MSTETAGQQFRQEYVHRVNVLTQALDEVGSTERSEEQRGVWTVTGRETVADRVREFLGVATDEVVYMSVESLLTDDLVRALRSASDRGVTPASRRRTRATPRGRPTSGT